VFCVADEGKSLAAPHYGDALRSTQRKEHKKRSMPEPEVIPQGRGGTLKEWRMLLLYGGGLSPKCWTSQYDQLGEHLNKNKHGLFGKRKQSGIHQVFGRQNQYHPKRRHSKRTSRLQ